MSQHRKVIPISQFSIPVPNRQIFISQDSYYRKNSREVIISLSNTRIQSSGDSLERHTSEQEKSYKEGCEREKEKNEDHDAYDVIYEPQFFSAPIPLRRHLTRYVDSSSTLRKV